MKNLFNEAHKMTREIRTKYEVNYQAQFTLCLNFLLEENKKGVVKMIKWERAIDDVLEFDVKKYVDIYKNGTKVGEAYYTYKLEEGQDNILEFTLLKNRETYYIKMTNKEVNRQILDKVKENKKEIEKFFDNIKNAKLTKLSSGQLVFINKDEEFKRLQGLHEKFNDIEENWIKENKKHFIEEEEAEKNSEGMIYFTTNYIFDKNTLVKEDTITENNDRLHALMHLADTTNDDDFEDITGLRREDYLI